MNALEIHYRAQLMRERCERELTELRQIAEHTHDNNALICIDRIERQLIGVMSGLKTLPTLIDMAAMFEASLATVPKKSEVLSFRQT